MLMMPKLVYGDKTSSSRGSLVCRYPSKNFRALAYQGMGGHGKELAAEENPLHEESLRVS